MIEVKDKQLECAKCGKTFLFSAQEAQAFLDRGLTNEPKKCPDCRAKERARKEQKVRTAVTCTTCGANFEVPFEPVRDAAGQPVRPLYCIEHFENRSQQQPA
jgi:CxxC-x17-CxxC domain-containing protein